MRFPGTLSARIIFGFAVLIVTYGAISANTMFNMNRLYSEVRVIHKGYLQLALKAQRLAERQKTLVDYLREELEEATRPAAVTRRLQHFRAARANLVKNIDEILIGLPDLPETHRRPMAVTRTLVENVRGLIAESDPYYDELLAAPPVRRNDDSAMDDEPRREASRALSVLRNHESDVNRQIVNLSKQQDSWLQKSAQILERGAEKLRALTIGFGAGAAIVGLAVIIIASLSLRPLQRLRLAAQRIAQGDYAGRIEEKGPSEVAALAREFNAMGAAVEERERELVRTERLAVVGKMAAMITHEVRNPLSSISLNTELLEEELSALPTDRAGEARNLCHAISTEVDRLTDITETYLHFTRLPKPKLQPEAINSIVKNTTDFEREQLAVQGVELEVSLSVDLPEVSVDDSQIRQALLNLLRNAADAVAEIGGGRVSVSTRRGPEPGTVQVRVQDDGAGIAKDIARKLFEPFFSTKEGGTGLGLALTHQIVKEHGGRLDVESEPGHGATFIVTLPRA